VNCDKLVLYPTKTDTFYYKVTNNQGCRDSARVVVKVNPLLTIPQNLAPVTACEASRAVLKLKTVSLPGLTYEWYKNNIKISGNNKDSLVFNTASLEDSGYYKVRIYNRCDTATSTTVFLRINPLTSNKVTSSTFIVCETNKIKIRQSAKGTAPFSYYWKKDNVLVTGADKDSLVISKSGYLDSGTYKGFAVGQCGIDSGSMQIVVHPKIYPKIAVNDIDQCFNQQSFTFTDSTALRWGKYTRIWTPADNSKPTDPKITRGNYSNGKRTIKLLVIPEYGCADSVTASIEIYPSPNTKLTFSDTVACFVEQKYALKDVSTIDYGTFTTLWKIDNIAQSNTTKNLNPVKLSNGIHEVQLISSSNYNCTDTARIQLVVNPNPKALYTSKDSTYCFTKQAFAFTDISTINYGSTQVKWRSSDGQASQDQVFQPKYISPGTYTIWETITSDKSCTDSVKFRIVVHPNPSASISKNDSLQCYNEQKFIFKDESKIAYTAISRQWVLNNQLLPDTTATLQLTKLAAGDYRLLLLPVSQFKCSDTVTTNFTVHPSPVVSYTISSPAFCKEKQAFVYTDKTKLQYGTYYTTWKFGDLLKDTGKLVKHEYKTHGIFNAGQVVRTGKGCTDSIAFNLEVYPTPNAQLKINATTHCFNEQNFVVEDIGNIAYHKQYRFWFFDGEMQPDTAKTLVLPEFAPGKHNIKIFNISEKSCQDSAEISIEVYPSPVVKNMVQDSSYCKNTQEFQFQDISALSAGTYQAVWKTGDNNKLVGKSVAKKYLKEGSYLVWHVITTDKMCTDSASFPVVVYPIPKAQTQVNYFTQCYLSQDFILKDISTIPYTQKTTEWYVDGDITPKTSPVLQPVNLDIGKHQIVLIPVSEFGCRDTQTTELTVFPDPKVKHSVSDTAYCIEKQNFRFYDSSWIYSGTFKVDWDFGDGNTSAKSNPIHDYEWPARYEIKHVVTSDKGCQDSSSSYVLVRPKPTTHFVVEDSMYELPRFVNFSSPQSKYFWDFGNGVQRTTFSQDAIGDVVFDFNKQRNYTITLHTLDAYGCEDTSSKTIYFLGPHIYVPNTIVINGSSVNKQFEASCFRCKQYTMQVFNRWGQLIYTSAEGDKFPSWNGEVNGVPAMEGTYVYLITAKDYSGGAHYRRGTFYILR
jgi:hypothetical protein